MCGRGEAHDVLHESGKRRGATDAAIRKMCVVIHLRCIRPSARATHLGKGNPLRVPRCIPSGYGADQASSLPAPAKRIAVLIPRRAWRVASPPAPNHARTSAVRPVRGGAFLLLPFNPTMTTVCRWSAKAYAARGPAHQGQSAPLNPASLPEGPTLRGLDDVRAFAP